MAVEKRHAQVLIFVDERYIEAANGAAVQMSGVKSDAWTFRPDQAATDEDGRRYIYTCAAISWPQVQRLALMLRLVFQDADKIEVNDDMTGVAMQGARMLGCFDVLAHHIGMEGETTLTTAQDVFKTRALTQIVLEQPAPESIA